MSDQDLGSLPPTRGEGQGLSAETMTRDERSCLVYLETCAVDAGGIVESVRMNAADMEAVERFREAGLLELWRIPASLLRERYLETWTHIVRLEPAGWALAATLRQVRAQKHGPFATACIDELARQGRFSSQPHPPGGHSHEG